MKHRDVLANARRKFGLSLRMDLRVGIVAAVATLLVAFGAFGLGKTSDVRADVLDTNVYLLDSHAIESTTGGATRYSCADGPGAYQIDPNELFTMFIGDSLFICVNTTASSPGLVGADVTNYNTANGTFDTADDGDVTFDSNDVGFFSEPSCTNPDSDTRVGEWPDDACVNTIGVGTDQMEIVATGNNLNTIIVRYTCSNLVDGGGAAVPLTIQQDQGSFQFRVLCLDEPDDFTITARPTTVEIVPARSNTSHSLIELAIVDDFGNPALAEGDVDFTTVPPAGGTGCSIEESGVDDLPELSNARIQTLALSTANPASYAAWEYGTAASTPVDSGTTGGTGTTTGRLSDNSDFFIGSYNADTDLPIDSRAAAVFGCNPVDAPGATPGVHTVTACVEVLEALDLCKSVTITVIGPPATITVAASPTSLRCGEKATITATVKDSIGQNVSDHTRVEMVTNLGGVIAGTGAVATFAGPTVPISSSVGETFGGVSTAFLLTSESHSGPYEVVATSGGTASNDPLLAGSFSSSASISTTSGTTLTATSIPGINVLGGIFSTPPVSAQVTVTCNIPGPTAAAPAATVTAPRTGEGISPPNTGDAGLASSSSSSLILFALGGAAALALAGLATFKFARR
jgi:hypothetical protein